MSAINEFLTQHAQQEQQRASVQSFLGPHTADAENPRWEELKTGGKRIHDWRTHIPTELRGDAWSHLGLEARTALVAMASGMAELEEHE